MLDNNEIGIFIRLVDAGGKTAKEIAEMYRTSAAKDPLGRVAFCTDAEADPRLADRFNQAILAYEGDYGEYEYIIGDIIDTDLAYDPDAPKGFKRKIMGAFSDLLPREFEREMKSTWLLLNTLRDLAAEEAAGMQCVLSNELSAPADLLDNRAASVNFTYFV